MTKQKSAKNFAIIFFLGISSGLPLALVLSTLKAMLLEKGFSIEVIGYFSLASLPYSLKLFFAPVIDSCAVPILTKIFGQRRSWIILSQIFLVIFIALLGVAGIFSNLFYIAIFAFLVAFASASQDVVIDGYRIELIEKDDQGLAASFYIYGYRIGLLISGAGALILAEFLGWDVVNFAMALFMVSAIAIVFFAEETRKNWQSQKSDFTGWFKASVVAPLVDFTRHYRWPAILAFIVLFKLGDVFASILTLPFLLEIGFSKVEIASIVKTFGLFATLFGVFAGGVMVKKLHIVESLWIAGIMQMISNFAFSYLSQIGANSHMLYVVIFIENFSGGIGDAVFVAYLSSLCSLAFSATQYALLASLASLARSLLASSAGVFAGVLGWYEFFIFSALLAVPGLIFLFFIDRRQKRDG